MQQVSAEAEAQKAEMQSLRKQLRAALTGVEVVQSQCNEKLKVETEKKVNQGLGEPARQERLPRHDAVGRAEGEA